MIAVASQAAPISSWPDLWRPFKNFLYIDSFIKLLSCQVHCLSITKIPWPNRREECSVSRYGDFVPLIDHVCGSSHLIKNGQNLGTESLLELCSLTQLLLPPPCKKYFANLACCTIIAAHHCVGLFFFVCSH